MAAEFNLFKLLRGIDIYLADKDRIIVLKWDYLARRHKVAPRLKFISTSDLYAKRIEALERAGLLDYQQPAVSVLKRVENEVG